MIPTAPTAAAEATAVTLIFTEKAAVCKEELRKYVNTAADK